MRTDARSSRTRLQVCGYAGIDGYSWTMDSSSASNENDLGVRPNFGPCMIMMKHGERHV